MTVWFAPGRDGNLYCRRCTVTQPQRHKLVATTTLVVTLCLILYFILFGFHTLDPKALILVVGFFVMAAKISTVKHRHNPMI